MAFEEWGNWLSKRFGSRWPLLVALSLVGALAVFAGIPLWQAALGWFFLVCLTLAGGRKAELKDVQTQPADHSRQSDPLSEITATIGALDMPLLVLDAEANVLSQNPACDRLLGTLPVGTHISARMRSPAVLDMVRETLATGRSNQIEHAERLPSQQVYMVRIAPVVLQMPAGGQRLYLLSFRDISELRRLDQMRSDFVANASHELRTPLASLRGFIETLQGPAKSDVQAQERFLSIMLDQATRMSRLVDDLLSLSRLELRSHVAPEGKIDLAPLLCHVRDSLAPLAHDLGVEIRLHLPEGAVEVAGERDELVQVFENLVENACKYGQDGKIVDVHLRPLDPGPVEVSVIDRGPGIPAEHVPRLTERFYRVSVADSRSKKGTGLGLAIVKHILTRHRARLIVRSELGRGSDFTVRF